MATYTNQDLATEAMRRLGVLEAQEEAAAEDAAHIIRKYENKFTEWQLREMAYWAVDAIPAEVFEYVARLIGAEIASSFGTPIPVETDENGDQVSMATIGLR